MLLQQFQQSCAAIAVPTVLCCYSSSHSPLLYSSSHTHLAVRFCLICAAYFSISRGLTWRTATVDADAGATRPSQVTRQLLNASCQVYFNSQIFELLFHCPSWKTTPCQWSATACSVYSPPPSTLGARLTNPQPEGEPYGSMGERERTKLAHERHQ